MKIVCVLSSNQFSGAENVVCQIIDMMKSEKNIEFAYCSRDGQIRDSLQEKGIHFLPIKNMSVKELKRVFKEYKPDVIHAHDMGATLYSALACGRIPLISHIHNNAYNSRGVSLKSIAYIFAGMISKHIFWVSESSFKGYCFNGLFRKKSEVLYNIINIDNTYERMKQDTNSYDYDIVYVGRLTYQKNPERLMQVCLEVAKKLPEVKIGIVGTGDLFEKTKELCGKLNLQKNIEFLGFISNPLKIMHDAKVMIMTSRWEGTPMCALEAMSFGVPIVSTPTDGLNELITDGVNGFLSNSDEVLVDMAVQLVLDEKMHTEFSDAAKEKSKKINDIQRYKDMVLKQYEKWGKV